MTDPKDPKPSLYSSAISKAYVQTERDIAARGAAKTERFFPSLKEKPQPTANDVLMALAEVSSNDLTGPVRKCWREYGHPLQCRTSLERLCFLELCRRDYAGYPWND